VIGSQRDRIVALYVA